MPTPSLFTRARLGLARLIAPSAIQRRSFAGAQVGAHYADWFASASSADAELRGAIRKLIDRSRSLERDNDYLRGFLWSVQRNINGSHRYDLRSDAGEWITKRTKSSGQTDPAWQPDTLAKRMIEDAWTEWGKKGTCTVDRKRTWRGVRRLSVRSVVRDGNVIIRKIRGPAARNRFGFALQLWEVDHLDLEKFGLTRSGGEIKFGIEFDAMQAPVAYWLRARHPGDTTSSGGRDTVSVRFPADEIYHLALDDRSEQSIGYPWIVSAITRLRQLGAFEEAAVIAARLGASKAGFFETTGESAWTGDTDSDGRAVMDVQPGTFEQLPQGWKATSTDWAYPNVETGDFRKAMLRGVCSSLGVSYTSLGNDLESVNFSSARVGLFEEREGWKDLQLFFSEELWEPIFTDWLEQAILSGALNLPMGKFPKFNRPVFKARRWAMIDPARETEALKTGIALRVTSRRSAIEDQGGDVEEVFHDNLDDEKLAENIGLDLTPPDPMPEAFEALTPPGGGKSPPPPEGDTPPPKAGAKK